MAWGTATTSALLTTDANFEAFDDGTNAIVLSLNPRELVDLVFSIASEIGEADDLEIQILGGSRIINNGITGTITSDTVIDLAAGDNEANDFYMGMYFLMTTGGEIKDVREIVDYVSSTDAATLVRALSGTPTITETYDIFHMRAIAQFIITAETVLTEDLPQNAGVTISGVPFVIARARSTGATDAHIALMTYRVDGVSI
ncbi:hypothetical protein LCGC14_0337830 [marine sediment metagenome]|uniref:Uncharacterized protein n=1 Tax=marine sediment metagenome TaxID=412755 RepID=A0A0F9TJX3_9ZZZZ